MTETNKQLIQKRLADIDAAIYDYSRMIVANEGKVKEIQMESRDCSDKIERLRFELGQLKLDLNNK